LYRAEVVSGTRDERHLGARLPAMRRVLALAGLCLPLLIVGCQIEQPLTGKPCASDDECDGPGETHYCQLHEAPYVCLPGARIEPAPNRPPLMARGVIVARVGETIEGGFAALDPDGDEVVFDASEPYTVGTLGVLTVEADGSYTFVATATAPDDDVETGVFDVRFSDGRDEVTGPVFAVVFDAGEGSDLLVWTGETSQAWEDPANWSPDVTAPDDSHSVLLVGDGQNQPAITGMGPVRRAFVTAEANLQGGTLAVRGDQLFSASPGHAVGSVFSLAGAAMQVAGEVSSLVVTAEATLLGATHASGDLRVEIGSLDLGDATLSVEGDVLVDPGARLVLDDPGARLLVDGTIELQDGAGWDEGWVQLGGDLTVAERARLGEGLTISFAGDSEQRVALAASAASSLWAATVEEGASVLFETGARLRDDLEVRGELVVDVDATLFVEGTLILRPQASWPGAAQGDVFAAACVVAPNLELPGHIHCDEDLDPPPDAGPVGGDGGGAADAGAGDGGGGGFVDGGVDAGAGGGDGGTLGDAGDPDGGIADGGTPDGGATDAGVGDGGVTDGGFDGGFDAGYDAGGFDGGVDAGYDAGGSDGGYDAGGDGGYDAGSDGGYDAGGFDGGFDAGYDAGDFDGGYDAGDFDAGYDAGDFDAGYDAGDFDAGYDGGLDAGYDAGFDDSGVFFDDGGLFDGLVSIDDGGV
jgi:hypothetical protein